MVNPALRVQAVGFRPWGDHWLGILVTPWFMNLVLMPRITERWQALAPRESRHHVFPAGVFEFIGAHDAAVGEYQACSLFSPMFDFADAIAARSTALASLDALFDAATREAGDIGAGPRLTAEAAVVEPAIVAAPAATALSKRSFLFGQPPQADRGP
jgi:[NiFe] hydrogenase assembly HybE family chaperone